MSSRFNTEVRTRRKNQAKGFPYVINEQNEEILNC